jgi:ubiquinone/menaquinone biosynthesis C-methylase UbiE
MPPPDLITVVNTNPRYAWFSEQGRKEASALRALALAHDLPLDQQARVLDFGCGCGRIARWLAPTVVEAGGKFHGSDLNPKLIGWCRANLQGNYRVNGLQPPMPFKAASVDLLYSMSVLTHLKLATAQAWLDDFARVLAPGGLAIISFHDEDLAPAELKPRLAAESWVLNTEVLEGSNYMGAFTTRAAFGEICSRRFEVLEMVASRPAEGHQALVVLRSRR